MEFGGCFFFIVFDEPDSLFFLFTKKNILVKGAFFVFVP